MSVMYPESRREQSHAASDNGKFDVQLPTIYVHRTRDKLEIFEVQQIRRYSTKIFWEIYLQFGLHVAPVTKVFDNLKPEYQRKQKLGYLSRTCCIASCVDAGWVARSSVDLLEKFMGIHGY